MTDNKICRGICGLDVLDSVRAAIDGAATIGLTSTPIRGGDTQLWPPVGPTIAEMIADGSLPAPLDDSQT